MYAGREAIRRTGALLRIGDVFSANWQWHSMRAYHSLLKEYQAEYKLKGMLCGYTADIAICHMIVSAHFENLIGVCHCDLIRRCLQADMRYEVTHIDEIGQSSSLFQGKHLFQRQYSHCHLNLLSFFPFLIDYFMSQTRQQFFESFFN